MSTLSSAFSHEWVLEGRRRGGMGICGDKRRSCGQSVLGNVLQIKQWSSQASASAIPRRKWSSPAMTTPVGNPAHPASPAPPSDPAAQSRPSVGHAAYRKERNGPLLRSTPGDCRDQAHPATGSRRSEKLAAEDIGNHAAICNFPQGVPQGCHLIAYCRHWPLHLPLGEHALGIQCSDALAAHGALPPLLPS